jgi:hypothetical protein
MIKLVASVCIEAPVASVWARLATLEDIQLWSEPVLHARCEGAVTQGVGAERTCELAGHRIVRDAEIPAYPRHPPLPRGRSTRAN